MPLRILITGSNGLLGQKLVAALRNDPEVELIATGRGGDRTPQALGDRYHTLDITEPDSVREVIISTRPTTIIHTAAMTNVDACELDPPACHRQNVQATQYLVEAAKDVGAHFIFLSTDFVFDGAQGPYTEEALPSPLSVYGHSKLEGERIVMNSGLEKWAVARTIIVYGVAPGLSRSNVVLWAKDALEKGAPIRVVNDQWRMPTLAEDLADGCIRIAKRGVTGIFNLSGPDGMTILELVERVGHFFRSDTRIIEAVGSDQLGQPARRPPRTGFVLDKARRELGYSPRTFEEGLAVLKTQLGSSEGVDR